MSIEALVKPPVFSLVQDWTFNRNSAVHTFPVVVFNTATPINVKRGHRYKVRASAGGVLSCVAGNIRFYEVVAGTEVIVSQRVGFDRGGWNAMTGIPINLCGLWTAPADAAVTFHFQMRRAVATDTDDELMFGYHNMQVEDLGLA